MLKNHRNFTFVFLLFTFAHFLTLNKNAHGQLYFNKNKMSKANDTTIMNILNVLEYKLEKNIIEEIDYFILAHLIEVINERKKYLSIDDRPDFWYSRQGK